jgi:hypothetical protein
MKCQDCSQPAKFYYLLDGEWPSCRCERCYKIAVAGFPNSIRKQITKEEYKILEIEYQLSM